MLRRRQETHQVALPVTRAHGPRAQEIPQVSFANCRTSSRRGPTCLCIDPVNSGGKQARFLLVS